MERAPAGHAPGLKSYLTGFALALILTAIPFALVATSALPPRPMLIVIAIAAIIQVLVHLRYFLHLDLTTTPRENLLASLDALRELALALRDALPAAERAAAAATIAARAFPVKVDPGMVVSGFSPMKTEINPIPLMRRLADAGAKLALPAVAGRGNPLTMRAWAFGEPLNSGQWGIREPFPDARVVEPEGAQLETFLKRQRGYKESEFWFLPAYNPGPALGDGKMEFTLGRFWINSPALGDKSGYQTSNQSSAA